VLGVGAGFSLPLKTDEQGPVDLAILPIRQVGPWTMRIERLATQRLRFEGLEGRTMLSATPGFRALGLASHAQTTSVATTSSNWSGYAVDSSKDSVSSVAGSWTVPAVAGSGTAYSSIWVGLDGSNSSTVEQIGTDSDVINGQAQYYAWYEMYPKDSVTATFLLDPEKFPE
jgi:hypothetical protein